MLELENWHYAFAEFQIEVGDENFVHLQLTNHFAICISLQVGIEDNFDGFRLIYESCIEFEYSFTYNLALLGSPN